MSEQDILNKITKETDEVFKELAKIIGQNNRLKDDVQAVLNNQQLIVSKLIKIEDKLKTL